jgi:hypothetical protein
MSHRRNTRFLTGFYEPNIRKLTMMKTEDMIIVEGRQHFDVVDCWRTNAIVSHPTRHTTKITPDSVMAGYPKEPKSVLLMELA